MVNVRRAVWSAGMLLVSAAAAFAQPQISVNGTPPPGSVSAQAGTTATIAIAGGPGNTTDWIGLYHPGDANSAFINWLYDDSCTKTAGGSSLSSGSCSFTMPSTAGTYELRLFTHDGFSVLAISLPITVT